MRIKGDSLTAHLSCIRVKERGCQADGGTVTAGLPVQCVQILRCRTQGQVLAGQFSDGAGAGSLRMLHTYAFDEGGDKLQYCRVLGLTMSWYCIH